MYKNYYGEILKTLNSHMFTQQYANHSMWTYVGYVFKNKKLKSVNPLFVLLKKE